MPFLNDLMPLATSPISSEILPRPPKSRSPTARTIIQCQMLREPMKSSVCSGAPRSPQGTDFDQKLCAKSGKNKRNRKAAEPAGRCHARPGRASRPRYEGRCLFLGALHRWSKSEVEVAGLQRLFVLPQRRIVGGHGDVKARRQRLFDEAGAFELVEAGKIGERIEPEM